MDHGSEPIEQVKERGLLDTRVPFHYNSQSVGCLDHTSSHTHFAKVLLHHPKHDPFVEDVSQCHGDALLDVGDVRVEEIKARIKAKWGDEGRLLFATGNPNSTTLYAPSPINLIERLGSQTVDDFHELPRPLRNRFVPTP